MPRPKGSTKLPSYCLHKASGRAYATIGGAEQYFGPFEDPASRAAYDRAIAEWLSAGRASANTITAPSPTMTVTTLLGKFWEHAKAHYPDPQFAAGKRPDGELGNYHAVIKIVRPLYGETAAADFGPRKLKALAAQMIGLKHSRNYINRNLSRVKAMFKWAVAEELINPSVYQALSTVAGLKYGRTEARETDRVKPVPEHILDATLPHLSRHVRTMVDLQLLTAARPGEICAMRTRDIDTSKAVWIYRPAKHKTAHHGHDREIRIGPKAQDVLRPFLKTDLAAHIFSPAEAEAERRATMHAQRKTPMNQGNKPGTNRKRTPQRAPRDQYDVDAYRRAIARACDRADTAARTDIETKDDQRIIPQWHPHQLRHNAATRLRRDYGVDAANIILGQTTLRATQIYAEMDHAKAEKIMAEVG